MNFFAILFNEAQHVTKTFTAGYVPVCYEVINLFIEPQNFLLMGLICKLKGLYLIVRAFDGLLMFFLYSFYTFFGEPFYKNNCLGFFRANSNFNCTIQINEDIMRIFSLPRLLVTPPPSISDLGWAWCNKNSLKLSLIFLMPR